MKLGRCWAGLLPMRPCDSLMLHAATGHLICAQLSLPTRPGDASRRTIAVGLENRTSSWIQMKCRLYQAHRKQSFVM